MKHISILIFSFFTISLFSQAYEFELDEAVYSQLTSTTSIGADVAWDDLDFYIPIGFPFPAGGIFHDSLRVNTNGYLTTTDENYEFNGYYVDMIGRGDESPILYKVDTSEIEKIFKIEYRNVGFYEDTLETSIANFQIWLYEGGCWEVRFGNAVLQDTVLIFEGYPGPFIGYADYDTDSGLALVGPSAAPVTEVMTAPFQFPTLTSAPTINQLYRFCPPGVQIGFRENETSTFSVFPNPSNGLITVNNLSGDNSGVTVTDLTGKIVYSVQLEGNIVDLSQLKKGVYFGTFVSLNGKTETAKIILVD